MLIVVVKIKFKSPFLSKFKGSVQDLEYTISRIHLTFILGKLTTACIHSYRHNTKRYVQIINYQELFLKRKLLTIKTLSIYNFDFIRKAIQQYLHLEGNYFIIIQYWYYLMHKLFVLAHLRTLQRLGLTEYNPTKFQEVMTKNNLVVSGESLLFRLPRQQMKHIIHSPCPISSLEQNNAEAIIKSSKILRHHFKMDQAKLCAKCPFSEKCPSSKKILEDVKYQNTIHDLLNFFHGLQNHPKPQTIFYRQWVSAYRLADSIIALIDDLSKGGKQTQEYDRIRVQGIKQFEQKMAQKKLNNQEEAKNDSNFQNVVSKLEKLSNQKPKQKVVKPKEQKTAEVLGRDFSFDQEGEFEPTAKFTKNSSERQAKGKPNGYQRIEDNEQRSKKSEFKSPYNGKSDKYSTEPRDESFQKYQPRQDKPYRKEYERQDRGYGKKQYQREERGDRSQWGAEPRNSGYQKEYQNNRYNDRNNDRGESRGQYRRQDRGNGYQGNKNRGQSNSYSNKFNPRSSQEDSSQFPKIRQFNKKQQYKPRDNYNQDQAASRNQKNPFISKFKNSSQQNQFEQPKPRATLKKEDNTSGSHPKIIEVQNIQTSQSNSSPRGRNIRRRRSSSTLNQDEN